MFKREAKGDTEVALTQEKFDAVANHVEALAAARGIQGIFAMQGAEGSPIFYQLINKDWILRTGVEGKLDVNSLGIVLCKMAYSIARNEPSGKADVPHIGEVGWCGTVVDENGIYGFSGGTEDEDVELSQSGADMYATLCVPF